jgi:hypothetical protein
MLQVVGLLLPQASGTIKEKGTEFQVKKSRKHPKTLNLIHFMPEKNYITFT